MIRKASLEDLQFIEDTYNEHFLHEAQNGAFTVFRKGIYPTRIDAEKAIGAESLYVYEKGGNIVGSLIMNKTQPPEYENIVWSQSFTDNEVMVIHLLMVRPSMSGKGIASSLVKYAGELAKSSSCRVLRLDTGSQNTPARSLYKKLGFQLVATASINVGGVIQHGDHLFLEKIL